MMAPLLLRRRRPAPVVWARVAARKGRGPHRPPVPRHHPRALARVSWPKVRRHATPILRLIHVRTRLLHGGVRSSVRRSGARVCRGSMQNGKMYGKIGGQEGRAAQLAPCGHAESAGLAPNTRAVRPHAHTSAGRNFNSVWRCLELARMLFLPRCSCTLNHQGESTKLTAKWTWTPGQHGEARANVRR